MARIGFRPSYLQDDVEQSVAATASPMQQHVSGDGGPQGNPMLTHARSRLLDAKFFMLTKRYARLSDRAKVRKLQDLEFLTLVVAQLS